MKVNILLSTYNGEQFLAEQVKSIQEQTYQEWQLLIRDDGSSDGTVEVIKQLAAQDSRIHFINENQVENVGVIKSFHALLKHSEADLILISVTRMIFGFLKKFHFKWQKPKSIHRINLYSFILI